jgi:long-chain acyl-CoA synthetase
VVVNHPSQVPLPGEPAPTRLRMLSAPTTFPELLEQCARPHGQRVFLPRRRAQVDEPITFAGLLADIDALATALLQLGIGRGDRVGLIAENRSEWLVVDQALASIGAIDVPRGSDTSPRELQFILRHSGCRAVFADDDKTARELLAMRGELPDLERVLVMQDHTDLPDVLALGDLLRQGHAAANSASTTLRSARAAVHPDDLLTIVYTSGTTADPKGVMLTHQSVLSNVDVVIKTLEVTANDSFLSVLPAWHMYERIMDYLALATGAQLLYTDRRHIKEDLIKLQPTIFAAVPRIWEMLYDGIVGQSLKLTGVKGKLLRQGLRTARAIGSGKAGLGDRLLQKALEPLVFHKVRRNLGGRLRLCVSGGGSLPRHVDETLLGLGLPLKNGYGLTETSPVASIRTLQHRDPGHIGPPLPNTTIEARGTDGKRCAAGQTGVLWIKGPQVMRGYYKNPTRTAEVLTGDGWFNSGDLGHVDADGKVWITGRAKDTIVLAGGENVEPEPVETVIKTSPLIAQVVCVGQDQKVLGALLVPDLDALEQRLPKAQWEERDGLLHGKPVQALLRAELDRLLVRANGMRPIERVGVLRVLAEPLTAENGMLTQTLKVRRHVVQKRFAAAIAAMFES